MKSFSEKLVREANRHVGRTGNRPRKRDFLLVLALMGGAYLAGFTLLIALYDDNASSEADETVSSEVSSRSEETTVSKQPPEQPAPNPPAVTAEAVPAETVSAPPGRASSASAVTPLESQVSPETASAEPAPAPLRVVDVLKDRVRVRKSPIDGEILGMVSSGRKITLVAREGDWCRIKTRRHEGWMICDALQL